MISQEEKNLLAERIGAEVTKRVLDLNVETLQRILDYSGTITVPVPATDTSRIEATVALRRDATLAELLDTVRPKTDPGPQRTDAERAESLRQRAAAANAASGTTYGDRV